MLGTLPNGPTAEEALVAVQGKTLWQTGHFLGCEHLTTLLPQWSGENAGPFLSILSAPFVGVFGIDAITARIPLVLLSILSMLAMYGIGKELGPGAMLRLIGAVTGLDHNILRYLPTAFKLVHVLHQPVKLLFVSSYCYKNHPFLPHAAIRLR